MHNCIESAGSVHAESVQCQWLQLFNATCVYWSTVYSRAVVGLVSGLGMVNCEMTLPVSHVTVV